MSLEPEMRELERRKLNVMEALIVAALIGMGGVIWMTRDAVIEMKTAVAYQADELNRLRTQLADVPALSQRVSKLEVQVDALNENQKELRQMKGLK